MWNRSCPLCYAKVPRSLVLTRAEGLACPSCHTPVELSRTSRVLSALAGLLAGYLAASVVYRTSTMGRWAFPMLAAVLAYAVGSGLLLLLLADLVVLPRASGGHFPQTHK